MECGHKSHNDRNLRCNKEHGHRGPHAHYADVDEKDTHVKFDGHHETNFTITEWGDSGGDQYPQESGRAFPCDFRMPTEEKQKILSLVISDAHHSLPEGQVFEIRAKVAPSDSSLWEFGRYRPSYEEQCEKWGIAWYHLPATENIPKRFAEQYKGLKQEPLFLLAPNEGEVQELGGYILIGRMKSLGKTPTRIRILSDGEML